MLKVIVTAAALSLSAMSAQAADITEHCDLYGRVEAKFEAMSDDDLKGILEGKGKADPSALGMTEEDVARFEVMNQNQTMGAGMIIVALMFRTHPEVAQAHMLQPKDGVPATDLANQMIMGLMGKANEAYETNCK